MHLLRTETDYEQALAEAEALFQAEPGTPEGDRLEVIVLLIEDYERRHHPVPPPDPIAALLYAMESRGLSPRDLEPYLRSGGRVAAVLDRERRLTLPMIRRLHAGLNLPAEILIQPYPLKSGAAARVDRGVR